MVLQTEPLTHFSTQVKRTLAVSAYTTLFNSAEGYTYVGNALPGTATSASTWQIKRITDATGNIEWASGNTAFSKVWNNRTSYVYS